MQVLGYPGLPKVILYMETERGERGGGEGIEGGRNERRGDGGRGEGSVKERLSK